MVIGRQFRQASIDLKNRPDMGKRPGFEPPNRIRAVMQILLSVVIVAVALYVLLHGGYSEATEKSMAGLIGTVLGYWLH